MAEEEEGVMGEVREGGGENEMTVLCSPYI